jgi:hypothetical protein
MPLQATSGAASYDAFGGGVPVVPNYIEEVFSTYLYTGNGSTQTITNNIDITGKGALVWLKRRNDAGYHVLTDTSRGAGLNISTNDTIAQYNDGQPTFNSNGFNLINNNPDYNASASTYASWTFRKQPKFFDVVTYSGSSSTQNIAHNLGSVPSCIIVKRTSGAEDWFVYHTSLGNTQYIKLNGTGAAASGFAAWNNTSPTSTQFTVLGGRTEVNAAGSDYVAYLFAHNAGGFGLTGTDNVISCGSYTGNGSTSGPSITLGYEPQWLLIKNASTAGRYWRMFDNMRGMPVPTSGGASGNSLEPNTLNAEAANDPAPIPNATGFSLATTNSNLNGNGDTFIYIAIRRGPMKVPTSGTSVYKGYTYTANGTAGRILTSASAPNADAVFQFNRAGGCAVVDRLRGFKSELPTYSTDAESASSYGITSINDTSIIQNAAGGFYVSWNFGSTNYVTQTFARAPSFFDEVCYKGVNPGSATLTITHNLTVTPELVIIRERPGYDWLVYSATTGTSNTLYLNLTNASTAYTSVSAVSTSTFTASGVANNDTSTYVAYLFATCAGVSKVGSYTGTGTTLQIDCGFTGGARFVLIKRTDATGAWYVWDSARGIVSGNDPYLLLNSQAAEVTNTDYIDTYSAGFEISSTAPAAINASGGTFIFLAIA